MARFFDQKNVCLAPKSGHAISLDNSWAVDVQAIH